MLFYSSFPPRGICSGNLRRPTCGWCCWDPGPRCTVEGVWRRHALCGLPLRPLWIEWIQPGFTVLSWKQVHFLTRRRRWTHLCPPSEQPTARSSESRGHCWASAGHGDGWHSSFSLLHHQKGPEEHKHTFDTLLPRGYATEKEPQGNLHPRQKHTCFLSSTGITAFFVSFFNSPGGNVMILEASKFAQI